LIVNNPFGAQPSAVLHAGGGDSGDPRPIAEASSDVVIL
jgi:hypothetical protein